MAHHQYIVKTASSVLLSWCLVFDASANSYQISDLGNRYYPFAINNANEVVANNGLPGNRGYIFRNNKWHPLSPQSVARALNDKDYVVGDLENLKTAVMWKPRGAEKVLNPPPFGAGARAWAINNSNMIVGNYESDTTRCFVKESGKHIRDMGMFPDGHLCFLFAINDAGQVTGGANLVDGSTHAFLWQGGTFKDLGFLPGTGSTYGFAISATGVVVGQALINADSGQAFLWNGEMINLAPDLHYASSAALGINSAQTVVGWAIYLHNRNQSAVRFAPNGSGIVMLEDEVTNLGDWRLTKATGIDEAGVIIGYGVHKSTGETHGFELIPQ